MVVAPPRDAKLHPDAGQRARRTTTANNLFCLVVVFLRREPPCCPSSRFRRPRQSIGLGEKNAARSSSHRHTLYIEEVGSE